MEDFQHLLRPAVLSVVFFISSKTCGITIIIYNHHYNPPVRVESAGGFGVFVGMFCDPIIILIIFLGSHQHFGNLLMGSLFSC